MYACETQPMSLSPELCLDTYFKAYLKLMLKELPVVIKVICDFSVIFKFYYRGKPLSV